MSDDEHRDDAPAARGAARAAPLDPEEQRASLFKVEHVPTDHDLKVCRVFTHMDIPALVYHLLRKLGLSLRFVLTRGPKGRALVTADQLALDDERERRWMAVNSAQREMLEAILYQRIEKLCESFTDSFKVFDAVGPDDPKCAQAVFEQLLTDFPLTHPGMHKQLLAHHLQKIMAFDSTDLDDMNRHFKSLSELRKILAFMPAQNINDVLLAVTLAMLKNSDHSRLNASYEKICDDIDAGKPLTFASVQTICASRLKRGKERARTRHAGDTPGTSPAKSSAGSTVGNGKNRWIKKGLAPETAVFAAMLEKNDVRPQDALKEYGITDYGDERVHNALMTACFPYFPAPRSPAAGTAFSETSDSDEDI